MQNKKDHSLVVENTRNKQFVFWEEIANFQQGYRILNKLYFTPEQ